MPFTVVLNRPTFFSILFCWLKARNESSVLWIRCTKICVRKVSYIWLTEWILVLIIFWFTTFRFFKVQDSPNHEKLCCYYAELEMFRRTSIISAIDLSVKIPRLAKIRNTDKKTKLPKPSFCKQFYLLMGKWRVRSGPTRTSLWTHFPPWRQAKFAISTSWHGEKALDTNIINLCGEALPSRYGTHSGQVRLIICNKRRIKQHFS